MPYPLASAGHSVVCLEGFEHVTQKTGGPFYPSYSGFLSQRITIFTIPVILREKAFWKSSPSSGIRDFGT